MKKILCVLSLLFWTEAAQAAAIFTIVPSLNSTYLRSDSQTVVAYTVTNSTQNAISDIIVDPAHDTTGQASLLSLMNNTCSGTLAAQASCTFQILIQGRSSNAQQPSSFTLSPAVCGFNGLVCSTTTNNNRAQITVNSVTTAFAYFSILGNSANAVVPVNTSTLAVGSPASATPTYGGIAVAMDGSQVYGAESGNGSTGLGVFSSGLNLQNIATLSLNGSWQVAVTPNGNNIYVTDFNSHVYVINKSGNEYTLEDTLNGFINSFGVATSPDGHAVYVSDYYGGVGANGAFLVIDTNTNQITARLDNGNDATCAFNGTASVVASPDNQTIYVGNQGNNMISVIQNSQSSYSCAAPIDIGQRMDGLAISPDGQYLYVIGVDTPELYVVNTNTQVVTGYSLADIGAYGVAVSPDGSKLFISNDSGNNAYYMALQNGLPSTGQPIAIDVGGVQQNQGTFIG